MAKKMEPLLSLGWAFLQQIQFQIDYVYFAFNFDSLFPRKSDLIKIKNLNRLHHGKKQGFLFTRYLISWVLHFYRFSNQKEEKHKIFCHIVRENNLADKVCRHIHTLLIAHIIEGMAVLTKFADFFLYIVCCDMCCI